MNLRILHSADYHIGMTFEKHSPIASKLAEARIEALSRIIDLANKRDCHILTIAGDLFQKINMRKDEVKSAISKLRDFLGAAVLILPGNHDYIGENTSLWEWVRQALPDNGHVLDKNEPVSLDRFDLPNIMVYPAPCSQKRSSENPVAWIKEYDIAKGAISLVIAHGSLEGLSPDINNYYPISQKDIDEIKSIDLWLLGHIHRSYPDVEEVKDERVFYAGTPEPDGLDCRHNGSCWLIDVDQAKNISAKKLWVGKYRFADEKVKIKDQNDFQQVINKYSKCKNTVLRLELSGWVPREGYTKFIRDGIPNKLWQEIEASVAHLVEINDDNLYPQIDSKTIKEEFTQGSFPYRLLKRLQSPGNEKALQAAYELIKEVQDEAG